MNIFYNGDICEIFQNKHEIVQLFQNFSTKDIIRKNFFHKARTLLLDIESYE